MRSPQALALERDAAVEGVEEHVVAAHQPLAEPLLPGLGEEGVRLRLVGHAEAGEDAALERPLLEDLGAQRVDGRDARPLEHVEGGRHPVALAPGARASARARSSRSRRRSFMVVAAFSVKVTAAISSSRARAGAHDRLDAVHEQRRLAGAGPRLEHEARGVVAPRALAASSSTGRKPLTRRPAAAGYSCSARSRTLIAWRRRCRSGLRPAHRGEVAAVAGGRLLHEDARATRGPRAGGEASRNSGALRDVGAEGHLAAAVHVVEEGVDHALAGEELRRGEHVERDLQLLAAAEDAAVVLRGAAGLVVAQDEARPRGGRSGRSCPETRSDAAVAEVDLERLGVVRLLRVARPRRGRSSARSGRASSARGGCRLAPQPALHRLVEAALLALPEQREARRAARHEALERLLGHLRAGARAARLGVAHRQLAAVAPLAQEALGHPVEEVAALERARSGARSSGSGAGWRRSTFCSRYRKPQRA